MRSALAISVAILTLGLSYGSVLAQIQPGEPPALELIRMIDPLSGWAVTREPDANELLRTIDGGIHWRDVTPLRPSRQQIRVYQVAVLTSLIAWVASARGDDTTQIFHTIDGGLTWRQAIIPAVGICGASIHFINARVGWALFCVGTYTGGEEIDIYRSTDGGENWIRVASVRSGNESSGLPSAGAKAGPTFLDTVTGWVTGGSNARDSIYLFVTHDGGRKWRQQTLPLPPYVTSPWSASTAPPQFFTARDGILPVSYTNETIAGWVIVFYVTHDAGTTWAYTAPVSVMRWWESQSSFADVNHGWVTEAGTVYVTNDGGRKWTTIRPNPRLGDVRQLDFISPQVGWAVSQTSPLLLKTLDGGHTWTPVTYTISRR